MATGLGLKEAKIFVENNEHRSAQLLLTDAQLGRLHYHINTEEGRKGTVSITSMDEYNTPDFLDLTHYS